MRTRIAIVASAAILILAFAPAALAADTVSWTGHGGIVSVDGAVDVPAGQTVDGVVVVNGTATIEGSADSVVLINSTATFTGATARHLVVVDSTASLVSGTTISGDIATLQGIVTRDASVTVLGRTTALDANLAALALALVPVLIVVWLGLYVAMVVAGLALAAFGSRQVRAAEALITRQPGQSLAAGLVATIVLPILFGLVTLTVIGAPIGLAMLLVGLPILGFVGWLVAAIWVGDWLLAKRGPVESDHPYRAAVLGVIVLAVAGILPFISAIATLFGLGAVMLAVWRGFRPSSPTPLAAGPESPAGWPGALPTTAA